MQTLAKQRREQKDEHVPTIAVKEPTVAPAASEDLKLARRHSRKAGLFDRDLLRAAFKHSLVMLRPDIQWKNPVMFVVEIGTVLTLIYTIAKLFGYPERRTGRISALARLLAGGNPVLCQLRFCHRRSPRQGPGRCTPQDKTHDSGPAGEAGRDDRTDGFYRPPRR